MEEKERGRKWKRKKWGRRKQRGVIWKRKGLRKEVDGRERGPERQKFQKKHAIREGLYKLFCERERENGCQCK